MHATRVLEIWLRRNCAFMHRARLAAMVKIVDGVVFGGKAMLAELGRGIRNHVLEKHNGTCADRLIGNAHLGSERPRSAADKPRSGLALSCSAFRCAHLSRLRAAREFFDSFSNSTPRHRAFRPQFATWSDSLRIVEAAHGKDHRVRKPFANPPHGRSASRAKYSLDVVPAIGFLRVR